MMSNDLVAMKRDHAADASGSVRAASARLEYSARAPGKVVGGPRELHLVQLGAILFLAPNALIALHLAGWACAVVLAGCALGWFVIWRGGAERDGALLAASIDAPTLAGCAALALALCLLGGEAHLFYANSDWLIRDAVLADLVNHGFPVSYRYAEQDYLLRAPLGMYMTPAFVGSIFGLGAAHVALLAQNAVIVAITLYFVAQLSKARKLPVALLFVAFSGADIVGIALDEFYVFVHTGEFIPVSHFEWWNTRIQYSSHITQLFWAPNHALPGWWFATLALLYTRREVDLPILMTSFAAMLFWSPLSMLGALPFLALFGVELLPRKILAPRVLLAAGAAVLFLPIALYLTIDASDVPHSFLFGMSGFATLYVCFLAIEIPHVAILVATRSKIEPGDRRILTLAVALLCVLPIYKFGPFNDLAMRASIPSLFLLAFAFSRVATLVPRDNGRLATCISAIVILSVATPMMELHRSFAGAYAISDCNFLTSWSKLDPKRWPTNYLARAANAPSWLAPMNDKRLALEDRICWPGNPMINAPR